MNVFGGALALLSTGGVKVGGVGVSGDTSCTDHMVAWRPRHALNLDHFGPMSAAVGGVATGATGGLSYPDNIIFDIYTNRRRRSPESNRNLEPERQRLRAPELLESAQPNLSSPGATSVSRQEENRSVSRLWFQSTRAVKDVRYDSTG